ncbi:MAG: amidase [Rhodobacteraceae bacterium]|nr:amidase [Paracoccaceae bacterium]
MTRPCDLSAALAAAAIARGELTSAELVRSCLDRIAERDPAVRAWAFLDPALAMAQARACDDGPVRGPLHGVPVGIKDMIDTGDMPTQYNSPLYSGFRPARDAACVSILRSAGAVILGKLDTVEFASHGRTAATANPHDTTRTPGGSSSGSGAAVGDGQVPVALGTQTGGSVIRPASFCGAHAMKPSYGLISTEGTKVYSQSLDTIGFFGRSAADLTLTARALGVIDSAAAPPDPGALRIGVFRGPHWDRAAPETVSAIERAAQALAGAGAALADVQGPQVFDALTDAQDVIMHWEGRGAYRAEYLGRYADLHPKFRDEVENTKGRSHDDVRRAANLIARGTMAFDDAFAGYDAWLTPSVIGEAPVGLLSTGEAIFNRMWTAMHGPCITLPAATGPNGLPVGVQIVAPRLADAALLAVAEAVAPVVGAR